MVRVWHVAPVVEKPQKGGYLILSFALDQVGPWNQLGWPKLQWNILGIVEDLQAVLRAVK